ncbi:integrase/recombinase XerC [Lishizhenia tianjinensis]|uniref:Integrase/recombinase XerC n=1 Tax=Lishizhenia tianjinensis TaxID=477690 RepID=A0A1I7BLP4_9FLAO|nr:tyrosine-type recombinase/integrase [Lishizhenia tianjinensis]SFT88090.1 integrase/recombinase XerC [Lishizhenia tianjinensis]
MLENFLTYLITEKRASEHTVIAYQKDLQDFFDFLAIDDFEELKEVNHQLVRSWMVHLIDNGVSNRSVNRKLSTLRTFYKWCLKEEVVEKNPMLLVKGPKTSKRLPEFVKVEELDNFNISQKVGANLEVEDMLMVEVFYQTGMRLSELINLKFTDIQNASLKVLGKRNKERIIPISSELLAGLNEMKSKRSDLAKTPYIFITKKGNKLYPKFVYRRINKYLSCVTNLDKRSPHVLRHTFATHMLNNGAGLETIKELLGHANLSATQVYTHNSFDEINKIYKQAHPRGGHNTK